MSHCELQPVSETVSWLFPSRVKEIIRLPICTILGVYMWGYPVCTRETPVVYFGMSGNGLRGKVFPDPCTCIFCAFAYRDNILGAQQMVCPEMTLYGYVGRRRSRRVERGVRSFARRGLESPTQSLNASRRRTAITGGGRAGCGVYGGGEDILLPTKHCR